MKCHNCGFESEHNYCPMCGAEIQNQPVAQNSPQASVPFAQPQNPYTQSVNNTQPAQQNIQPNPYMNPTQAVSQNVQNPPYMHTPQGVPMSNNMQSAVPTAMQQNNKTSKKTSGVIIASILGGVILIGTIIFSFSCVSEHFFQEEKNTAFVFEPDFTDYHTGDVVKTSYGNITLKSMEEVHVTEQPDISDEDYTISYIEQKYQYKLTFIIKNTSENTITVSSDDFSVSYDSQISNNNCAEITDIKDTYPQYAKIKAGETKEFSIYRYVSTNAYNLNTEYRYSDDDKNIKYLFQFSDCIEYKASATSSADFTYSQYLPFGRIALSDAVQTNTKGNSTKTYAFTFKIDNNSSKDIKVSTNDFAINAYKDYYDLSDKYICPISNDEIFEIKANQSEEITISCDIPNDRHMLYTYYKLNNHITNPDEAVSDTNYNIYSSIELPWLLNNLSCELI